MSTDYILPEIYPVISDDQGVDAPYWEGTRQEELRIQRCIDCREYQWGPELVCHHCHSFNLTFEAVAARGTIYSWERVWHPTRPELVPYMPYVILVVELDEVPGIQLIGNLVGDQKAPLQIGTPVQAHFEHHDKYTLVQWRASGVSASL